jgi:hydroxymethylpyrimidine/phosphomethylpyrimidine kinase
MRLERPYVMSIAGFDPSGGAGLLADVKCLEQHQVYGFGICTALTVQSDAKFFSCRWLDADDIIAQITPLMEQFRISACKIGLIRDVSVLLEVISYIRSVDQSIKVVFDPVLKSSSGYAFHEWNLEVLLPVLENLTLLTPNYYEMQRLGNNLNAEEAACIWSQYSPVLLKGGHNKKAPGLDLLFEQQSTTRFEPELKDASSKHGSGCVLSAAITANLARGLPLDQACREAKGYTAGVLNSNTSLLGYHSFQNDYANR